MFVPSGSQNYGSFQTGFIHKYTYIQICCTFLYNLLLHKLLIVDKPLIKYSDPLSTIINTTLQHVLRAVNGEKRVSVYTDRLVLMCNVTSNYSCQYNVCLLNISINYKAAWNRNTTVK